MLLWASFYSFKRPHCIQYHDRTWFIPHWRSELTQITSSDHNWDYLWRKPFYSLSATADCKCYSNQVNRGLLLAEWWVSINSPSTGSSPHFDSQALSSTEIQGYTNPTTLDSGHYSGAKSLRSPQNCHLAAFEKSQNPLILKPPAMPTNFLLWCALDLTKIREWLSLTSKFPMI